MNVVYRIGLSIIIFYALILNLHAYDEGFNGLDWGDPPKPGMNLLDSRGYFKFYSDDLDQVNKDLSDYGIEGITYGFCRDTIPFPGSCRKMLLGDPAEETVQPSV